MPNALLITDGGLVNAAEQSIVDRLEGLGWTVDIRDDNDTPNRVNDEATYDLLFFSGTTSASTGFPDDYLNHAIYTIVAHNIFMQEFGFGTGAEGSTTDTKVEIVNNTHPITSGLSLGVITVFSTAGTLEYIKTPVAANAIILAQRDGDNTRIPIVLLEDADSPSGRARITYYFDTATPGVQTAASWDLFDRIVAYGVPNAPPEVTQPADQTNFEGDVVSLQIQATDPDNDDLTYAIDVGSALPPGLSLNTDTGLISGTINNTGKDSSPYAVSGTVTDGVNPAVAFSFTWTINNRVPVANADAELTTVGQGELIQLLGSGTDPDGTIVAYRWTPPAGVVLSDSTAQNPTADSTGLAPDTYSFILEVQDDDLVWSNPDSIIITVTDIGVPVGQWTENRHVQTGKPGVAFARLIGEWQDVEVDEVHHIDMAGIFAGFVELWSRGGLRETLTFTVEVSDAVVYHRVTADSPPPEGSEVVGEEIPYWVQEWGEWSVLRTGDGVSPNDAYLAIIHDHEAPPNQPRRWRVRADAEVE